MLHDKRELRLQIKLQVANQLTLKQGEYPGLSGGPSVITRVFKGLPWWSNSLASNAGEVGSVPGQGSNNPHDSQLGWKIFLKKESLNVEERGRKVSEQCNEKNVLTLMAFKLKAAHKPRTAGNLWKVEKTRKHILTLSLHKGTQLC